MKEDVALSVQNLSKVFLLPRERKNTLKEWALHFKRPTYEKLQALKDVSFEVERGEFFGIVGRNGSGKSTLLKIIGGIYQPTRGRVKVNGSLTPFIELGIGFNPELTGRENVYLNGAILGLTRKEIKAKYHQIVGFSELERFMDQKLKNYSSGMQVRLAFSIAIQAHNDILLIDEVLAVGDANFQRKCFGVFKDIKNSGKTVIFVTHDMGAVQRFCDRGLVLEEGKIKVMGDPSEVANGYQEINLTGLETEESPAAKKLDRTDVSLKIIDYDKPAQKLRFEISYKNFKRKKVYVGFSIVKDGVTVGELNSLGHEQANPNGQLEYLLDTSKLNPGYYEIAAGLIEFESRQLLKATDAKDRAKFNVLGHDEKRGAAMHLPDNWVIR